MIVDYRTPRPLSELQRSEQRGWIGFVIWVPSMLAAGIIFVLVLEWMKSFK